MKTVSEISKQTGVSVRTLRYYDAIDLLPPASVTEGDRPRKRRGHRGLVKQVIDMYCAPA